jgi:hypothetical protein
MSEDDRARPVSGEIMAGDAARAQSRRAAADFTDADYETVGAAREAAAPRFSEAEPASGMDFLRAGAKVIDAHSQRGGPLFWIVGLTLVVLAFWVSGGHALVRQQVAALAPAETRAALRIEEVKSRVERHGDRAVLFVDGRAENHGPVPLALPPIEIAVREVGGGTTRYFLGTNGAELAPGDRYAFSSRLEAPRNGVEQVSVTFQEGVR